MDDQYSKNEFGDGTEKTPRDASDATKLPHAGLLGPDGKPIQEIEETRRTQDNDAKITQAASEISKWVIRWAAVTAVATMAQVGIAAYINYSNSKSQTDQFNQMKSVADRMEGAAKSFAGNSANINQGIADATRELQAQAKATEDARKASEINSKQALQATIDNFHLEQRAWVVIKALDVVGVTVKPGSFLDAKITVTNVGKTPAKMAVVESGSQIYTELVTGKLPADRAPDFQPKYIVIPPNETPSTMTPRIKNTDGTDAVMDTAEIAKLTNGQHFFYVFGRITYEDVFGFPHQTLYCGILNPDLTTFHSCPKQYANAD